MRPHLPRQDTQTAQQIKEALAMQRAFGDDAARAFLRLRHVPQAVTDRVLAAPYHERRQF